MTISIFLSLVCCVCFTIIYRDYRNDSAPKWLTIPFMIVFIVLSIALLVAGNMNLIT